MKAHTNFYKTGYSKCKLEVISPLFLTLIAGSLVLMGAMTADNIGYSQTMPSNSSNQTSISIQDEQENLTSVTNDTQSSNMSEILSNSSVIGENASLNPQVKIISHTKGQEIPVGTLSVKGISSDNSASACDVYVLLNGIKPYQKVTPIGQSGSSNGNRDYSLWNFTFLPTYGLITEGDNKMTAKITCITGNENATKFNSLNVTGVASNNSNSNISAAETANSLKNASENVSNNSTSGLPSSNATYIKSPSVIPQQPPPTEGVIPNGFQTNYTSSSPSDTQNSSLGQTAPNNNSSLESNSEPNNSQQIPLDREVSDQTKEAVDRFIGRVQGTVENRLQEALKMRLPFELVTPTP